MVLYPFRETASNSPTAKTMVMEGIGGMAVIMHPHPVQTATSGSSIARTPITATDLMIAPMM